jgi:hypothetical protein
MAAAGRPLAVDGCGECGVPPGWQHEQTCVVVHLLAGSAGVYRTLRDIADRHITLHVDVARFDPQTGVPLDPPRVGRTWPDRLPARSVPDAAGEWWLTLAEMGLLRLPELHEAQVWHVTDTGRDWLTRHDQPPPTYPAAPVN